MVRYGNEYCALCGEWLGRESETKTAVHRYSGSSCIECGARATATPAPARTGLWGLCVSNSGIATRTGPGTGYAEGPGLSAAEARGKEFRVISRAYDSRNEIWWVKIEIPGQGYYWTGYSRFDKTLLPLESIPLD